MVRVDGKTPEEYLREKFGVEALLESASKTKLVQDISVPRAHLSQKLRGFWDPEQKNGEVIVTSFNQAKKTKGGNMANSLEKALLSVVPGGERVRLSDIYSLLEEITGLSSWTIRERVKRGELRSPLKVCNKNGEPLSEHQSYYIENTSEGIVGGEEEAPDIYDAKVVDLDEPIWVTDPVWFVKQLKEVEGLASFRIKTKDGEIEAVFE